ncbi:MAG TPA: DUF6191 domain-containing protein [Amycolatopsis sp.]|nr:DUF6191 domain-containing protein [Amycolatopsis sp.]
MDWLALALPGGVVLLVIVGAWEVRPGNRRSRFKKRLSATYLEETTAFLYGTKRTELDHRDTMSMLFEEEAQGAPPRHQVDLEGGVARIREPG